MSGTGAPDIGLSRALITGIAGFAGGHLAERLHARGVEVAGYTLRPGDNAAFADVTTYGDVNDVPALAKAIDATRPDVVFHLAGFAAVGEAWSHRRAVFEVNTLGSIACLEALEQAGSDARMVLVSSGLVYGPVPAEGLPVGEDHATRPRGPYAVSKLCAEIATTEQAHTRGQDLVIARPFNFAGPGQGRGFVAADFAAQIARAEATDAPTEIMVGNLEAERDFIDVRDLADGLCTIAAGGESGAAYNLCSGRSVPIREVLDRLLDASTANVAVTQDPARMRPADVRRFVGNPARAADLGWSADIPLSTTLADTLAWWRRRLAHPDPVDA